MSKWIIGNVYVNENLDDKLSISSDEIPCQCARSMRTVLRTTNNNTITVSSTETTCDRDNLNKKPTVEIGSQLPWLGFVFIAENIESVR